MTNTFSSIHDFAILLVMVTLSAAVLNFFSFSNEVGFNRRAETASETAAGRPIFLVHSVKPGPRNLLRGWAVPHGTIALLARSSPAVLKIG